MKKIKLFVLAVNVWDADDYLNGRNCNPKQTDIYLYATRKEAEQKAQNLDVDDDIYNDCTIYTGELTEQEIIDITGYETIEEFNEALAEPYSTNPNVKNLGEFEKGNVAKEILDNHTDEDIIECANYDFNKSLEGCILVFWSWERYIGYARKCIEVRRAYSDDTKTLLTKRDKVFVTQCDILLTADEVSNTDNLQEDILQALAKSSWKWTNPEFVRDEVKSFE